MSDANTENELVNVACSENKTAVDVKIEKEIETNTNAENEATEEPDPENRVTEEPDPETKVMKELKSGNEMKENANAQYEITEQNTENEVRENVNAITEQNTENEVRENVNAITERLCSCSKFLKEKLKNAVFLKNTVCFVSKMGHYMQMHYDILKRGSSDIESENIDLSLTVKLMLKNSIKDYSTENLGKYLPIASPENRRKVLERAIYGEMVHCCINERGPEIIRECALCFLAAFDLQETMEFEDAVKYATLTIMEALFLTDQYWINHYERR